MSDALPSYFTHLAPFRQLFATGVPILTYHKFGPRPRGTRLRGLHLPTALFRQQLEELRADGCGSASVGDALTASGAKRIVLTIDDGFRSVREEALPLLQASGFQATLYLVADRLGGWNDWETAQGEAAARLMDVAEVKEWIAAGQRIGAHSLTHPWLTRLSIDAAREEIRACRARLEDLFGLPVLDFCYPYGAWNRTLRDEVEAAGYRTATTTDFGVNPAGTDPFALRRITARHASRSIRNVRGWWGRWWNRLRGSHRAADP